VLDQEENLPGWLQQLHQEWQIQATAGFMGCINLSLDEVATDGGRIAILLKLSALTNEAFASHGQFVPAAVLNNLKYKPLDGVWTGAVATVKFLEVGQLFGHLLEGKLQTTASSPLTYLEPDN
jgi:hypothetical protein